MNKKIIIKISHEYKVYSQDVSLNEKKYYEQVSGNSSDSKIFKYWTRPIKIKLINIKQYEEEFHFIYVWLSNFKKTSKYQKWMGHSDTILEVLNK